MEELGLVEADFQQYYHLNLYQYYHNMLSKPGGFLRYNRLFENLPPNSRIMTKLRPGGSWLWSDETASRVLAELSQIKSVLYNSNKGKNKKAIKPDKQFQPEYVEKAKEEYLKWQKEQANDQDDAEVMKAFWQARNPNIKIL